MYDTKDLARTICSMGYKHLRSVACDLAEMIKDKEARPQLKTTEDFAELLYDWAEAQDGAA